jgi:hypothetical protein
MESLVLIDDFLDGRHFGLQQAALARGRRDRTRVQPGCLLVVLRRRRQHDVAGEALVAALGIVDQGLVAGDHGPAGLQHLGQAEGDLHFFGIVGADSRGDGPGRDDHRSTRNDVHAEP